MVSPVAGTSLNFKDFTPVARHADLLYFRFAPERIPSRIDRIVFALYARKSTEGAFGLYFGGSRRIESLVRRFGSIRIARRRLSKNHLCIDDARYQKFRKVVHQKWLQRLFLSLPLALRLTPWQIKAERPYKSTTAYSGSNFIPDCAANCFPIRKSRLPCTKKHSTPRCTTD